MIHAVIVAAGEGKRFGKKKQFVSISGLPVIIHTLTAFCSSGLFDTVVCVVAKEDISYFESLMNAYPQMKVAVLEGGSCRQESVAAGVFFLEKNYSSNDRVVIHDGVRPFVTPVLMNKVVDAASDLQGAVAALPVSDSLKQVSLDGQILRSIAREGVWAMQTPQAFSLGVLAQALRKANADGFVGTDDAEIVERIGHPVVCVMGEKENIKITTVSDLSQA